MTNEELKTKAKSSYIPPPAGVPTKSGRKVLKTFTEDVPVKLSKRELRETGAQLAHQFSEMSNHEAKKAEVKSELKAREDAIKSNIEALALRLNGKTQLRPVQCREEADYSNGIVEIIREDNGEVIRNRPLKTEERQDKLAFAPESDVKKDDDFGASNALKLGAGAAKLDEDDIDG